MEAYQTFNVSLLTSEEKKIEQVRDLLVEVRQDSLESLKIVDSIQRLGICYLFKDEIDSILHHQYSAKMGNDHDALFKASLRFRLLRQHGYEVVAGGLVGETRGVMAMHEASHLNMGGEEILHEAAVFSSSYLNKKASICLGDDDVEAKMAKHFLVYPQHKNLAGFTEKSYLQFLNGENPLLGELAEFEFRNLQSLHKHEILRVLE